MLKENYTEVTEFVLLGLTDRVELQPALFVVFLVIYLITVFSNVSMILLIRTDSKLQTPMYFFLSHLSFVDLCYATNVMPQMLVNLLSKRKTISFLGCFIQFDFSFPWGSQIAICSQQWLMTITWPSANPCYMASNVPRCPPLSRCCISYLRLCKRSCTDHPGAPPLLLWTQGNQPLLLCGPTSPSPGLLRHLCQ